MSYLPTRWSALAIVLALATMVGCQGLSTGKSNVQTTQNPLPGTLGAAPGSVSFGNVQVGTSQSQSNTLSNTGGTSLTVTKADVTGAGFSITGLTLPLTLSPAVGKTFSVTFSPQTAGAATGTLVFTNSDLSTLTIPLSGTAVGAGSLTGNPTSFSFGSVQIGSQSSQTETLKNTGGEDLTISQATVSGSGYSYSGLTLPLTLASNQSTTFGVVFAPTTAGASAGKLSITISGSSTTLDIALSGTGVTPATLTATPASLTFTNITVGQNQSQTETVKNTGGVSATISSATAAGAGFSISGITTPVTLTPGQSASFSVTFAPQSAGNFSGSVAIASNASNPALNVTLTGSAIAQSTGTLTATPASLTFTNITVGQNQSQTETVKNTGGVSATISSATAAGAGFSISGITTPVTLTPGQSASFSVTFAPQSAGNFSGSVAIVSNASNPALNVALAGSAIAQSTGTLSVSPVNAGSVVVGTSGTQTGTLTATGASVSVTSVGLSGANSSEFSISGLSFPVTVTTSQPVTFTVTFTPGATGTASASASFASTASNSPTAAALSGTGTPAPVHTVSLSWTASTTTGVTSYNVYRAVFGTSCGSYTNIGSTPGSTTAYTDSVVADGTTYCYATTAVDPSGESAYSNISKAVIPAP
jgi:hypothetical protein